MASSFVVTANCVNETTLLGFPCKWCIKVNLLIFIDQPDMCGMTNYGIVVVAAAAFMPFHSFIPFLSLCSLTHVAPARA